MKNHMTVLCGDEKDSALPTHTPTRASNALSLRKTVIGGMLVALTVALSGFSVPIGASRCFPIQHFINVIAGVFLGPGIWRRHGFLHLSDPESHGYRQSAGLPRKHGGSIPGRISLPENRPLCSSLCRRDNRNRNHWGNALLSGGSPPNG